MSTWFWETVTCPACGAEQQARLARGVHVSRAPEVREQVLDRAFHRPACARCATRFAVERPLVYTDMDRKHWLQVALDDERPRWPELEAAADRLFEGAFTGGPLADRIRDGFKVRLVFGVEELREKLVIWRAGYDDRIVECVKLRAFAERPELARAHRLLVDAIDGSRLTVLVEEAPGRLAAELALPRAAVDAAHDAYDALRERLPELFGGRFVSTHRLLGHRYRWADPAAE